MSSPTTTLNSKSTVIKDLIPFAPNFDETETDKPRITNVVAKTLSLFVDELINCQKTNYFFSQNILQCVLVDLLSYDPLDTKTIELIAKVKRAIEPLAAQTANQNDIYQVLDEHLASGKIIEACQIIEQLRNNRDLYADRYRETYVRLHQAKELYDHLRFELFHSLDAACVNIEANKKNYFSDVHALLESKELFEAVKLIRDKVSHVHNQQERKASAEVTQTTSSSTQAKTSKPTFSFNLSSSNLETAQEQTPNETEANFENFSFSASNTETPTEQHQSDSHEQLESIPFSFGNPQTDAGQNEGNSNTTLSNLSFSLGKDSSMNRSTIQAKRRAQISINDIDTMPNDFQNLSVFSVDSQNTEEDQKKLASQTTEQLPNLTTTQTSLTTTQTTSKPFTFSDADEKELKANDSVNFDLNSLKELSSQGQYKEALAKILLIKDLETKVDLLKQFIIYASNPQKNYPRNFVLAARAQVIVRQLTKFLGDNTFDFTGNRSEDDVAMLWFSFVALVMRNKDVDYSDLNSPSEKPNEYHKEVSILGDMVELLSTLLNDYQYAQLMTRIGNKLKKDPSRLTTIDKNILNTSVLRPSAFFYRDALKYYPKWLEEFEEVYNKIKEVPYLADCSTIDNLRAKPIFSSSLNKQSRK